MTTELPDNIQVRWVKATSAEGREYEVGVPSDTHAEEVVDATDKSRTSFTVYVNWPLAPAGSPWVTASQEVQTQAAISRYRLVPNDNPVFYTCILWFTNTARNHYYFKDKTGDVYQVNTFELGDHFLKYNSSDSTIVNITGF